MDTRRAPCYGPSMSDPTLPIPPHVALVVGHRPSSRGAVSKDGRVNEFDYNSQIAPEVQRILESRDIECVVIFRPDKPKGKKSQYEQMVDLVNASEALVAVELHLNAVGSPAAFGASVLYSGSTRGREVAQAVQAAVVAALGTQDRGVHARAREGRGGSFLHDTKMPAVIVEPGFVSNPEDLTRLRTRTAEYALALADGITNYFRAEGALEV